MKKLLTIIMSIIVIFTLTACEKKNITVAGTANQQSETVSDAEKKQGETKKAAKDGFPSNFEECKGDSTYFQPITEDYAIQIADNGIMETELICFDEKGEIVYDVLRRSYQDSKEAEMNINSGETAAASSTEFVEGTYALSDNSIYERKKIDSNENLAVGECPKLYFMDQTYTGEYVWWFSIPNLTESQMGIINYCEESDFAAASYFDPSTEDYYLKGDTVEYWNGTQSNRTILLSFDEVGKCVQIDEFEVFESEAAAREATGYQEGTEDTYTRLGDGVICNKRDETTIQQSPDSKESLYFNFKRYEKLSDVDFKAGDGKEWFSKPSLTEKQNTKYQELISKLNQ